MASVLLSTLHQSNAAFQTIEKSKVKKQPIRAILPLLASYTTKSYALFNEILSSAKPFVSCGGTHKISFEHYTGSVSLDRLEKSVVSLIDSNPKFNEAERACGEAIDTLISAYRNQCNQLVRKKRCLIKMIFKIVRFFKNIFTSKNLYYTEGYFRYFCFSVPPLMAREFSDIPLKEVYQIYDDVITTLQYKTQKIKNDGEIVFVDESECIQLAAKKYANICKENPDLETKHVLFELSTWVHQELVGPSSRSIF